MELVERHQHGVTATIDEQQLRPRRCQSWRRSRCGSNQPIVWFVARLDVRQQPVVRQLGWPGAKQQPVARQRLAKQLGWLDVRQRLARQLGWLGAKQLAGKRRLVSVSRRRLVKQRLAERPRRTMTC